MTTINSGVGGELSYNFSQTAKHVGIAAALKIGTTDAHAEQGVARESYLFFSTIEYYTARSMTGCMQNLQAMGAKADNFAI